MAWKTEGDSSLHIGDIIVIVGYFAFVLFVGLWSSRQNRGTAGGYFLAGRNMHWIPVGASLFASNIGSLHFVGLAGSGAASGIAIVLYELFAMFILLGLGYIFLPVYIASGVFTMPEYLKRRFGGKRIQMYLAVLALLVYIFTKISADLYAGALFIEQAVGWDIYPAILLLLAIAAIFTITGGLTAVLWTDFIQTVIMLVGAFVLMAISLDKVGGLEGLVEKYPLAVASGGLHAYTNSTNVTEGGDITSDVTKPASLVTEDDSVTVRSVRNVTSDDTWERQLRRNACGLPREDFMHLFRDPATGDLPWPGVLGIIINGTWYWCADQVIVQRSLAGKTYDHSKLGCVLCGYLKFLPFFLLVVPGMVARVLFTETVGCWDPDVCLEICGSRTGCSNIAYPILVLNLLPAGARGMMLAVMMSALMSSLTSIFNSSSTIFAMDVWTHIRHRASELEVMIVGRTFVVVLVVISIIWVPVLRASQGSQLFVYIQEVSSFLQPPICAVFLLALSWPRFNEKGAFVSLVIGMAIGLVRFAVQYAYTVPECGSGVPDPTPSFVKEVHYLYFSALLFGVTVLIAVVVTFMTRPVDARCIERLTWWSRHSQEPCWDINQWSRDPEAYSAKMAAEQNPDTKPPADHNGEKHADTSFVEKNAGSDDVKSSPNEGEVKMMTKTAEEGEGGSAGQTPVGKERQSESHEGEKEEVTGTEEKEEAVAPHTTRENLCSSESTAVSVTQNLESNAVIIEEDMTYIKGGPSLVRRVLQWVCGVEAGSQTTDAATHEVQQQDMVSIRQHPRWKLVSNILAVVLAIGATAMLVVYA